MKLHAFSKGAVIRARRDDGKTCTEGDKASSESVPLSRTYHADTGKAYLSKTR